MKKKIKTTESRFESHQIAVDQTIRHLKEQGFECVENGLPTYLEHSQFCINKRCRREAFWMPCDLTINIRGQLADLKVYRVRDKPFSSIFRVMSYGIEANSGRPFVQVVVGQLPDFLRMFPQSMKLMPKTCRVTSVEGLVPVLLQVTKPQRSRGQLTFDLRETGS